MSDVARYAGDNDLLDILPLLEKGAVAAQNPTSYGNFDIFNVNDHAVLYDESTHRWKHPWALYYTIILNSIAAAIQGWDQTGKITAK